VLYWMLNDHRLPFLPMPPALSTFSDEEQAKLRRFRGDPIPAPKYGSEALKAVVLKACAFDPADRFHSAAEMLQALEAAGKPQPITQPPSTPDPENTERVRPARVQENREAQAGPDDTSLASIWNELPQDPDEKRKRYGCLPRILALLILLLIFLSFIALIQQLSSEQETSPTQDSSFTQDLSPPQYR